MFMASMQRFAASAGIASVADELASAVEQMPTGTAFFRADAGLLYCNRACRALLDGVEAPEKLLATWTQALDCLAEQGGAESHHLDVNTPAGRSLRVSKGIARNGTALLFIVDRTESAELLHAARAQLANVVSSKNALLGSLSQRIRVSLNSMLGFAQLSQRDPQEPLAKRHQERLEQLLEEGGRLLNLFDRVLEFATIATISSREVESLSLPDVAEEVLTMLEPLAARAGVQVGALVRQANIPNVLGERSRVTRILMLYATNAIQSNHAGGAVRFRISTAGNFVRLTVADTGQGLPDSLANGLFEPLGIPVNQRRANGSGMGLAIAKALAQSMNGRVGCRSVPSLGSEFWLELPLEDSTTSSGMRPAVSASSLGDYRASHT